MPYFQTYLHPQGMLKDKNFYVELPDGMPHLKKKHSNGYYSQIQVTIGLSQLKFCDFIVYSLFQYRVTNHAFLSWMFFKAIMEN